MYAYIMVLARETDGLLETATAFQMMLIGLGMLTGAIVLYAVAKKFGSDEDEFGGILSFISIFLLMGAIYALYRGLFGS